MTTDEPEDDRVHLTTSATCIESLLGCPTRYRSAKHDAEAAAKAFASTVMDRAAEDWVSERSASIYCRCRGLPLAIRFLGQYDDRLADHVRRIIRQLQVDPGRFAIGEADVKDGQSETEIEKARKTSWYPPNAFHTFWTLEILRLISERFPEKYRALSAELGLQRTIQGMLLWSRRTLGYQVALHAADSSILDSDQLGWSLATLLKFAEAFPADLGEQDLLRETLKQLFKTQLPIGTWRHYRSLFHYEAAGNAYCYVYETFAVLLGIAVDDLAGRQLFRDSLREYVQNLTRLWQYAESTRLALGPQDGDKPSAVGWCSGHRLNQTLAESWATASVFSFIQALRRLLGVWTRESTRTDLNFVKPVFDKASDEILKDRGNTWLQGDEPGVSERLLTLFVNPIRRNGIGELLEPDVEPIREHQARSAILFGPPGTSKTTLCKALAAAIRWDYVEVHASHFVADGLQNVQRRADMIFRRLMEIDRTVVLFDEIDELVRDREAEHDAFGRFLTTSMLPKLAELWEQRKIIYFVATNHIKYFDRAITRSQRFDALILVSPPAYEAKIDRLKKIFEKRGYNPIFGDLKKPIWDSLKRAGKKSEGETTLDEEILAKFVLLRWDQLEELAFHLIGINAPTIDEDTMQGALKKIGDRKLLEKDPYVEFVADLSYPRRDFDKELVWRASGFDKSYEPDVLTTNNGQWLIVRNADAPPNELHGFTLNLHSIGDVSYTPVGA